LFLGGASAFGKYLKTRTKIHAADIMARLVLRFSRFEPILVRACRSPTMLRLGVGAVALGYARVLDAPAERIADMGRYRLHVNLQEHLGIASYFFRDPATVWLLPKLVGPGAVCLDVGANAGYYTFALSALAGPTGHVVAFEPNPVNAGLLRKSVKLNQHLARVDVDQRALWREADCQLKFFLSTNTQNSGTASLVRHGVDQADTNTTNVATTTLDEVVEQLGVRGIDLLKIDVERAEADVLAGGTRTLSSHRVDCVLAELVRGGEAEQQLTTLGYKGFEVDAPRQRLKPLNRVPSNTLGDYLFLSPKKLEEFAPLIQSMADD